MSRRPLGVARPVATDRPHDVSAHGLRSRTCAVGRGSSDRRPDRPRRAARDSPVRARQRRIASQPSHRAVAAGRHRTGLATLLDLLTEARNGRTPHRAGIASTSPRWPGVWWRPWTGWRGGRSVAELTRGLLGASTGAAAALIAARRAPRQGAHGGVPGGRPDLAGDACPLVAAPVLLVVGSADDAVLGPDGEAAQWLFVSHRIHVVPGATRRFPEPGALETVAEAAVDWLRDHLSGGTDDERSG